VIELRRVAAVVLLFVGVGAGLHLLVEPLRGDGEGVVRQALTLGVGLALVGLGMTGGYLLARIPRQRLCRIADHLEALVHRRTVGLTVGDAEADSLGRLGRAVNRYLAFVKEQVDQAHMAVKERQIQVKVLEAEKRQIEAVIHAITDGVLVMDAFGDLVLTNRAAESILGFAFEPGRRVPVEEVIQDERLLGLLREALESGTLVPHRVAEWVLGAGREARTFQVTLNTVFEGHRGGRVAAVVAVLRDVTREKEMARLKSDFVSAVAHELKAPLTSIRAYTEMLLDEEAADPAEARGFLQVIAGETERLTRLIEKTLNLSRLESGLVPVHKTDLAVTELVREVVEVLAPQAEAKHLRLEADLTPVFFRVHGDRDMLYQALLNVVSNAVKYTPEGGRTAITTYLADGAVVVQVSDTGVGIPPEDLGKVFEKFFRSRRTVGQAPGTGLGLALVKHVIETVHGGRIAVESEVGKGTTFRLYLPAVR